MENIEIERLKYLINDEFCSVGFVFNKQGYKIYSFWQSPEVQFYLIDTVDRTNVDSLSELIIK